MQYYISGSMIEVAMQCNTQQSEPDTQVLATCLQCMSYYEARLG